MAISELSSFLESSCPRCYHHLWMLKSNLLLVGGSMKVSVALMMVIANGLLATAMMAEPMPLPAPGSVSAPWIERVFLTNNDISVEEAAHFRIVDDAEVGRALVVGPWLAGNWSARAEFDKDFLPENVNIAGLYRTVDLPHTSPVVRCECFDTLGKRLTNVSYYLPLSSQWKPFSLRFDKFPVGTHYVRFAFGLQTHALGNVWFAQLETQLAGEHPLSNLYEPELTRDSSPPQQRGTGFFRVEKYGKTWWLIDPDGLPYFSMATPAPSTSGSRDDFDAARQYVKQLRSWGFNGLAGWHNLSYYGTYNRMLAGQGDRPMPQFCVINYHDALDYGSYEFLTDRNGHQKAQEHGFPDPFDPGFVSAARRKAQKTTRELRDASWFVCWFLDNEISYDELYRYVWSTHCSEAFLAFLRDRYPTIVALNRSWGTQYLDFDQLKAERPEPKLQRGPKYDDFIAFERRIVECFIDVTLEATRAADPNHLIASNRHHIGGVEVWMRHIDLWARCDLVALSMYPRHQHPGLGPTMLAILHDVAKRTDRPIIFGEWSVPALDSGLYRQTKAKLDWSFPECVPDQRIRASQAKHILADFFNHPSVVGAHWFTYFDSDSSARQANRGLVRVDGQPWQTLVNELTGLHGHIHRYMSVNTK